MPGQTSTLALPYPLPGDTVDVPRDIRALAEAVDPLGMIPIGAFVMWPGASAPSERWLLMLGQPVPAATYPGLAAVLGQVGGLVTIPDMRDVFPVGAGTSYSVGARGGAAVVALTAESQLPPHAHTVSDPGHAHSASSTGMNRNNPHAHDGATGTVLMGSGGEGLIGYLAPGPGNGFGVKQLGAGFTTNPTDVNHEHAVTVNGAGTGLTTQSAGSSVAHENRPPFQAVNFIIRAL